MEATSHLDLACDWQRALNVAPGGRGPYGYLRTWSGLGGLVLAEDIVVWNPLGGSGSESLLSGPTVTCAAAIERFAYGGDPTDPIRIVCLVSKENQANLRATLGRDLATLKVKASWSVVDYDPSAKAWFAAVELLEARQLAGIVNTQDGALQIGVERTPTPLEGTQGIEVYRFVFELVPPPRQVARLQFSLGQSQRIVCPWGETD
jgi:hypothetical protein